MFSSVATTGLTVGGQGTMFSALGLVAPINSGLFSQTSDVIIPINAPLTSLIGTGTGTTTVPAYSLSESSTFNISAKGMFVAGGLNSWDFDVQINGTSIFSSLPGFNTGIPAGSVYDMSLDFVIRSVGVTGTVVFNGMFRIIDGLRIIGVPLSTPTPVVINTTIANTLDILAQPISANDSLTSQMVRINKVF